MAAGVKSRPVPGVALGTGAVRKSARMAQMELEDALLRQGPRRDVREILAEAYAEEGTLMGVAERYDVDSSTVSVWLSGPLRGRFVGRGSRKRLAFEGYRLPAHLEEGA